MERDPKQYTIVTCTLDTLEGEKNKMHASGYDIQKMERIKNPDFSLTYILHGTLNLERWKDPRQTDIFPKPRARREGDQ